MTSELEGKVVVVTGSGQGLGAAYAHDLAGRGVRVTVAEKDPERAAAVAGAIERAGGEALAVPTDVSDDASVNAMVDATVARFGRLDGLVNNAGVYDGLRPAPAADIDIDRWRRVMDVNVWGTFVCARAAHRVMREAGSGRIVNVSSSTALLGVPMMSDYVASKGAIIALTKSLAREWGGDGITVNTLAPGGTWSEASEHLFGSTDEAPVDPAQVRAASIAQQAVGRQQYPGDLVGAVAFLLSDGAAMITGQLLVVDGGLALH